MAKWLLILALVLLVCAARPVRADGPRGWLIIPSIDLYTTIDPAPIVDQQYVIPAYGAAHLDGTAWVDDGAYRVVLAGHTPGTFDRLHEVGQGDRIIVNSHLAAYDFRVTRRLVTGDTVHWLMPTDTPTLTLITCLERGQTWLIVEAQESD
jgi:LPXTG-site transpeptidase (sortase) family protein